MVYDKDNIFAKILRGEIPSKEVASNTYAYAFRDIAPQVPVHILVIPRACVVNFSDFSSLSSEEKEGFWDLVQEVIGNENLNSEGYRLVTNAGTNGNQEVPHFHVHVLGGKFLGRLLP